MLNQDSKNKKVISIYKDIRTDSLIFRFEISFNKNTDAQLLNNSKLLIVDADGIVVENEIIFNRESYKATFIAINPYEIDKVYYIASQSKIITYKPGNKPAPNYNPNPIKRHLKFIIDQEKTLNFMKVSDERTSLSGNSKSESNSSGSGTNSSSSTDTAHPNNSILIYAESAYRLLGANVYNGKLSLYSDRLEFKANNADVWRAFLSNIIDVNAHATISAIIIKDLNGDESIFQVNDRNEWITQIEKLI